MHFSNASPSPLYRPHLGAHNLREDGRDDRNYTITAGTYKLTREVVTANALIVLQLRKDRNSRLGIDGDGGEGYRGPTGTLAISEKGIVVPSKTSVKCSTHLSSRAVLLSVRDPSFFFICGWEAWYVRPPRDRTIAYVSRQSWW